MRVDLRFWILSVVLMIGAPAVAQTQATLVLPVPGAPLAVEIVEERTTKLPDGTSKTEVLTSKVYRDGAGRMRTETEAPAASGESEPIVHIFNQPDGFMAILLTREKGGGRVQFSQKQQSEGGFGFSNPSPLTGVTGKKTSKTESLGKQIIEGVEFEGTRSTTTVYDQPSIIGIEESWAASKLGLFGKLRISDANLEITARIRNVDRHDPDPELFKIPLDYLIQDLKPDDPTQ